MKSFSLAGSLTNALLCQFQYQDTWNALADAWDNDDHTVSEDALDVAWNRMDDQRRRVIRMDTMRANAYTPIPDDMGIPSIFA